MNSAREKRSPRLTITHYPETIARKDSALRPRNVIIGPRAQLQPGLLVSGHKRGTNPADEPITSGLPVILPELAVGEYPTIPITQKGLGMARLPITNGFAPSQLK